MVTVRACPGRAAASAWDSTGPSAWASAPSCGGGTQVRATGKGDRPCQAQILVNLAAVSLASSPRRQPHQRFSRRSQTSPLTSTR